MSFPCCKAFYTPVLHDYGLRHRTRKKRPGTAQHARNSPPPQHPKIVGIDVSHEKKSPGGELGRVSAQATALFGHSSISNFSNFLFFSSLF